MPVETALEQYACDHCKQRKLRCSREAPKCNNCQEWSGICIYSRHGRIRRRPRSNVLFKSKLGTSLPKETNSTAATSSPSFKEPFPENPVSQVPSPSSLLADEEELYPDNGEQNETIHEKLLDYHDGQSFYIGPSPTASFMAQANSNIDKLKGKFCDQSFQKSAENSLSDLSNSFAAVNFDDGSTVQTSVRSFRRNNEVFFIPGREEGMRMMQIFKIGIEKGRPFFTSPPQNLLPKIVFEPSTVQERGWLLLFNAFLSTALSLMSSPDARLNRGVQWNTWLLLDDASIFLEPSEVSIQALVLVATHGQEISTPSLCWTLISQACQMAQNLALHLPTPNAPKNSEAYSQRICVFWSLFILDKSVSLSFGRPPLLPGYLYKGVPPLDPAELAKYRPHEKLEKHEALPSESFGSFYIMRSKELANIQGDIQDTFYRGGRSDNAQIAILKRRLDLWIENTLQSAPMYESFLADAEEKAAVRLGINNLTFQHLHLTVYLTKGDKTNHDACLTAARSAICMLDQLVSNSNQVFNGIVWQLLYQPFTPYFVVFANVISDAHSVDCFTDLQLLRKVVLYFLQMHNNHQSAKRLEKVTETFTRLAEAYVRQSMQGTQRVSGGQKRNLNSVYQPTDSSAYYPSMAPSSVNPGPSDLFNPSERFSPILHSQDRSQFAFDSLDSDPIALLDFFSHPDSNMSSTASFMTDNMGSLDSLNEYESHQQQPFSATLDYAPNLLIRGIENIAQNYGLDGSFDWFSWDQYDCPTP